MTPGTVKYDLAQVLQLKNYTEVGITLEKEEMLARTVLREIGRKDIGHIDIAAFHFGLDKEVFKKRHIQSTHEVHTVPGYMPLVVLVEIQQRYICFRIKNTHTRPFEDVELDVLNPQFSLVQQVMHPAKLDIQVIQPVGVLEFEEITGELDRFVLVNPVVFGT